MHRDRRAGDVVDDRFELLGFAGAGGMGAVFRALDRSTQRVVALKLIDRRDPRPATSAAEGRCGSIDRRDPRPATSAAEGRCGSIDRRDPRPAISAAEGRCGSIDRRDPRPATSAAEGRCGSIDPQGDDADRVSSEAALLASIDHPGVVRYLDHGTTRAGAQFLVMEWVTGVDLESWLERGKLTWEHALALARRVAEALAATHARGVVHRDIKPANLLLVDDRIDAIKLVDFGIAGDIEELSESDPGIIVGTPEYMAPEAARGEPVDARADVYGLGAVLFRALAGRPVFTSAHRLAVLAKVLLEVPPPICDLRADVPIELEELLARMLAKDPARRPADGAAVAAALADIATASVGRDARSRRPAVTAGEARVTSIVVCGGRSRGDLTVPIARLGVEHAYIEDLALRAGGALEALLDGSLVVHLEAGTPAELAARAASCALRVAELRPTTPVVVATGQVVKAGGSAVGEVIDRAVAELARGAAAGVAPGVRVDATTASLLDQRFELDPQALQVDGWRRVLAESEAVAPTRMFLGRPASCLGRDAELAALTAALDDAFTTPRARVVMVMARPGLGKSRLVGELLLRSSMRGALVLGARADAVRAGASFALASRLLAHAIELGVAGPGGDRLGQLLAEIGGDDDARPDASVTADAMRGAWCDWLAGLCTTPLVVVLEDLQWGDLPSLRLVDAALGRLASHRLLVLATARPEVHDAFPALWAERDAWQIRIGPLPRAAAEQLVRDALGPRCDDATVDTLVARAAGHPFHLEEMVRAVAGGAGASALPETVLGMVQSRLDELDGDARRVLRAASVFGEEFWADGVAALVGDALSSDTIARHLDALCEAEVIGRAGAGYAFRHALVRDAVYATLPDTDRVVAHRAAGVWLETAGAGVGDAAVLADHFDRGGAPQRALRQLRRAAEQALDGEDLSRATGFVERAMRCGPEESELGRLISIDAEIAVWRGDFERGAERALAAADMLEPGSASWFAALAHAITAFGQRGHNDRVAEQLDRAAAAGVESGAEGACATALCRGLTQLYWAHYRGNVARARRRVDALSHEALEPYDAGWVHRVRAESAWLHGRDIDGALGTLAASIDAFGAAGAVRALCLTRLNTASLAGWSGAHERAQALVADGVADAARLGAGFLGTYARVVDVVIGAYAGDPSSPRRLRDALASVGGSPRLAFLCRVYLGWLADEAGDRDVAAADGEAALLLPVVPELRAAGVALRSRVLGRRGETGAALAAAEQAVEAVVASGDLELTEGFPALVLAEALAAAGHREAARSAIAVGHARLIALANTIAEPGHRAAFLARPLPNVRIIELARAWEIG